MCKIAIMTGINDTNRKLAWEVLMDVADPMSKFNNDGLGYAAVTTEGELFGERWLNNNDAFKDRTLVTEAELRSRALVEPYGGALESGMSEAKYNKFGLGESDKMCAITLHTRMATSAKGLVNTHPFVLGNTSLIHNGIIRNPESIGLTQSSCDSEAILNVYVKHKVSADIRNIQKAANKLAGYYACGVITKNLNGVSVVDVFKDATARLSGVLTDKLGMIFITDPTDLEWICRKHGVEIVKVYNFKGGHIVRINAATGEVMDSHKFDSKGVDHYTSGSYSKWKGNSNVVERDFNKKDGSSKLTFSDKDDTVKLTKDGWEYSDGTWKRVSQ